MFELPPTFNPARRHLLGAGSALALGGLLPAGAAAQALDGRRRTAGAQRGIVVERIRRAAERRQC